MPCCSPSEFGGGVGKVFPFRRVRSVSIYFSLLLLTTSWSCLDFCLTLAQRITHGSQVGCDKGFSKKAIFFFFFFFSLHYFFFSLLNTKAIIHLPNILIPHPSTSSLNLQSMSLHVNNSQRFLFFPKQIYSISAARTINPEDSWMLWNQNLKWVQWKFVTLCQLTLWIVLWVIQVQLPPQLLFFFFLNFWLPARSSAYTFNLDDPCDHISFYLLASITPSPALEW